MNGLGSEALQGPAHQGGTQDTRPDYSVPYFKTRIWVGILGLNIAGLRFVNEDLRGSGSPSGA